MRRTLPIAVLATAAVAALAAAGAQGRGAAGAADPGVTAREVVIGGTVPLSGVAAAYASVARGAEAYFKHVNARGGVNGRRIRYIYYDDAYNPQQTVQQVRRLVQEDDVFAVFNSLGTEHNLAVRSFLNQARVPHVFPASGATTFGRDWRRYPMKTAGFQPSYLAEGRIYGKTIGGLKRRARVAVLYQNDDYGKDVLNGLKQGLRFYGRGGRVVGQQSYEITEVDVSSQIARLRSTRADMLVLVATPGPAIRAFIAVNRLGWRPRIIVNAVASASNIIRIAEASSSARATNGLISAVFIKDPQDPGQAKTAGIRLYRSIFRRHGTGNVNDAFNVYGMAAAYTFVEALKKAGRTPTRVGLLRALTSLRIRNNPFVIPGVTIATSRTDRFPLETARLQRWSRGRWVTYGPLLSPKIR